MAVGDYEKLEAERRAAWKQHMRRYDEESNRQYDAAVARREEYLRDLLARLPFTWHVAHAYTAQETATYGGADHIVVDEPIRIGRLKREPGDALSRSKRKFWGLHEVEAGRLPTSLADIKIAERIVASLPAGAKKTVKQLEREIAEALHRR